jgi:transposase-like protein
MARGYPPEFRRKVLDLVKAGRPVRGVARDLEISEQTIYVWRRQDLIDSGQVPGVTFADQADLVAARKRIAELETELAITRRATELLREVVPPKVRFEAIAAMAADGLPVQVCCRAAGRGGASLLLRVRRPAHGGRVAPGCAVRRAASPLEHLGLDTDPVWTPPWWEDNASAVRDASIQQGLEGIVGKPLRSRYYPGKRREWIKINSVWVIASVECTLSTFVLLIASLMVIGV